MILSLQLRLSQEVEGAEAEGRFLPSFPPSSSPFVPSLSLTFNGGFKRWMLENIQHEI